MRRSMRSLMLALANILIPIAVLVFATGFFPYKPFLPGLARYEDTGEGEPPEAPFDKVIFMVVDALRSDFVFSRNSGFKFTQSLIRSGAAIPFTAHATSPTITMPRVKAITTGSIPSFLDVILNFAESDTTSTLANQDTWLAQIKAKESGKLIMFGDDTWLKLFPDTFTRADGTSSFFVSDFTEVDNNVTRHVPHELRKSDWNAMIMHYLGLDHIGHKAGPQSPNMVPKQIEMDGIVQQIYEAMLEQPHLQSALFVLCGDHGMNEGGNHGGSAPGETSPALVFMSPKLRAISNGTGCPALPREEFDYYSTIEQSDIAPTLAGLLGFPIPLNNLGVLIPDFLSLWPDSKDQIQLLFRNALQIMTIVKATFGAALYDDPPADPNCQNPPSNEIELLCLWRSVQHAMAEHPDNTDFERAVPALLKFCRRAQDIMSSTASNYNISRLFLGSGLAVVSLVLTVLSHSSHFSSITTDGIVFTVFMLLYSIMMFASSFVEEEQHFWYWSTSAWLAYLMVSKIQSEDRRRSRTSAFALASALALSFLRITRRWNQTGQKFAGAPDIVHDFLFAYPYVLWALIALTYVLLFLQLRVHLSRATTYRSQDLLGTITAAGICFESFLFKLVFTLHDAPELLPGLSPAAKETLGRLPLVPAARMVFIGLFGAVVTITLTSVSHFQRLISEFMSRDDSARRTGNTNIPRGLHDMLTLLLITQTRVQNIPLFLVFKSISSCLSVLHLTTFQTSVTTLLMAHASFFALGNSNAISSIDLSNAYNGVSGYNVVAVGVLVFVSNWAGPIWWAISGIVMLADGQRETGADAPARAQNDAARAAEASVPEREQRSKSKTRPFPPPPASGSANQTSLPSPSISAPSPSPYTAYLTIATLFTSLSLVSVMLACTLLRTHLFIWTVFSPKYLYAMAWSVGFHLGVSGLAAGSVWAGRVLGGGGLAMRSGGLAER